MPYSSHKFTGRDDGGYSNTYIKKFMSTRKMFGIGKKKLTDDEFSAVTSSTPAEEWFWHVYTASQDQGASSQDITAHVKLTYYVKFYHRSQLTTS